jgi:GAF domain-containing protein
MEKAEKYRLLDRQVAALLEGETDVIAKMANVAAVLHETFGFWWTGFYRVALVGSVGEPVEPPSPSELVLGPFQGPVACMHIPFGKGVCGTAWKRNETVVVPDVEQFPGHIACSSASRSEIVVPVHGPDGAVTAVLDIDSDRLATFDEEDKVWLEKIVTWL